MYGLEMFVTGTYKIEDVYLIKSNIKRNTNPEIEKIIEEKWKKRISQNPDSFNGKLLRFSGYGYDDSKIEILASETTFKDHIGCLEGNLLDKYPPSYISWPLNFHSSITTSDNKILIGLRSKNVYDNQKNYALFGGVVSPDELKEFTAECALSLELEQEILNPKNDPGFKYNKKFICFGIARNNNSYNTNILFNTWINISSKELIERANYDRQHEHDEIRILENDPKEVKKFIDQNKEVTVPQCLALLDLYIEYNSK